MAPRPSSRAGQSLVEFAVVLPLLLLLLVGMVEIARLVSHLLVLQHAGYTAVRQAAVGDADSTVTGHLLEPLGLLVPNAGTYTESYEEDPASGELLYRVRFSADGDPQWAEMTLLPAAATRAEGDGIRVSLTLQFQPIFLGWILPESMPFTIEAAGRAEVTPGG